MIFFTHDLLLRTGKYEIKNYKYKYNTVIIIIIITIIIAVTHLLTFI